MSELRPYHFAIATPKSIDIVDSEFKTVGKLKIERDTILVIVQLTNGLLATGESNGNIRVWNLEKLDLVKTLANVLVPSVHILFQLLDGSLFSTTLMCSAFCFWYLCDDDEGDSHITLTTRYIIHSAIQLMDGRLVFGNSNGSIDVFHIKTKSTVRLGEQDNDPGPVSALLQLSNDRLISGSAHERYIYIWDLKNMELEQIVCSFDLPRHICRISFDEFVAGNESIFVFTNEDNEVKVKLKLKCRLSRKSAEMRSLVFSPDEKLLSASIDNQIVVHNFNDLSNKWVYFGDRIQVVHTREDIKQFHRNLHDILIDHLVKDVHGIVKSFLV